MENSWNQILQVLEHCLDPGIFTIWVSRLGAELSGETLKIRATNSFVAGWVQNRLGGVITEAASSVLGFVPKLEFEVGRASAPASRPAAPAPLPLPLQFSGSAAESYTQAPSVFSGAFSAPVNGVSATRDELASHESFFSHGASAYGSHGSNVPHGPNVPYVTGDSRSLSLQADTGAQDRPSEQLVQQLSLPVSYQGLDRSAERSRACNWRYSFDDFVVGPCNELAYAASRNVCSSTQLMDVLYLSSTPGLGKTHLLQAAGRGLSLAANRRDLRTEYLTAEEFCSQLFASIKNRATDSFKTRFRDLDLLLLEDVHFLQGKEKMQDELLATLKSINEKGGRVVLSSSFGPSDLHDMDDQLISRFSSGLIAKIERPDHETRLKIIREKSRLHQVVLPDNVTELLASRIHNDVRQIEGCLQNLVLKAKVLNTQVTLGMALETLQNYSSLEPSLNFEDIVMQICSGFNLTIDQLNSRSRKREYVVARNAAYYLARKHTDLSLQQIGERFNRKHSSVLKGITSLEQEISRESLMGRQLQRTIGLIERSGSIQL